MIGNDIIDLSLAETESNWQRKGFLEKQFTAKEQAIIDTAYPFSIHTGITALPWSSGDSRPDISDYYLSASPDIITGFRGITLPLNLNLSLSLIMTILNGI